MKRVLFACLEQTVHFQLKEEVEHTAAVRAVNEELEIFKGKLERTGKKYKIVEQTTQPDESIIIKIKRQYNDYDCGTYIE